MSDDDPMVFLRQQREKLAAMAEMAAVAQAQAAIADNVQRRMARINSLLDGSAEAVVDAAQGAARSIANQENSNPATAGMTDKEEEEYWKQKIALLSQPVTASGAAGGGGGGGSGGVARATAVASPGRGGGSGYGAKTSWEQEREQRQQRQQRRQPSPAAATAAVASASSSRRRAGGGGRDFGHKSAEPTSPVRRTSLISGAAGGRRPVVASPTGQYGGSPGRQHMPGRRQQSHTGEPVRDTPTGFAPTPPGWARARDKKTGRYCEFVF